MYLKVHSTNRCPACGRENTSRRTRRSQLTRWLKPNSRLMKCRLCLTRYLVRGSTEG